MIDIDTCGHTSTLPPFYMVFVMVLVSVPLTILIAGAPVIARKTADESANLLAKAKDVAVLLSKLLFLLITWMAMYTDATNVLTTFDATRGFWGTVYCANLIVATGGMANYFKAAAILSLITSRINWVSGHDGSWKVNNQFAGFVGQITSGGFDRKTWAAIFDCQGKITGVMVLSSFIFYYPWYIVNVTLYQIPFAIVYIWVAVPLFGIMYKLFLERIPLWLMSVVGNTVSRNRNSYADMDLPEPDLLHPEPEKYQYEPRVMHLMAWQSSISDFPLDYTAVVKATEITEVHETLGVNQDVMIEDLRERWYPKTKEQFENTGAPGGGWHMYVYHLLMSNLNAQLFTMVMVELYSGSGYLGAISNTFWHRSFLVWSGTLVATVTEAQQGWTYVLTQSL